MCPVAASKGRTEARAARALASRFGPGSTSARSERKAAPKRRRVQHQALEQLARLERGDASEPGNRGPRPKLTKLEGPGEARSQHVRPPRVSQEAYDTLSDKQKELLQAVAGTPTVQAAALDLGVSRSNVYASLRRIARKLEVTSVPELVALSRQGGLPAGEG